MPSATSFTTARSAANGTLERARRALRLARGRDWLRLPERDAYEPGVKPAPYVPIYDRLLAPLRLRRCSILELGVWDGDSLVMWRDGLRRATIVGVDLFPPELELGERVHIVQGDQTDPELMRRIACDHAPDGFDVIIDDASHIGITTARSLQILFGVHLRPGGIYVIEDWGTGYLPDFYDGGPVGEPIAVATLDSSPATMRPDVNAPIPLPSHDVGMVGVVKRLVDHVARGTIAYGSPELVGEALPIASMEVYDGIVVLRKSR
jgi:SAM-dependent methyltransferase